MTPQKLDFIFPFFVFFYGFLMVLVLEFPLFVKLGQERLSQAYAQLEKHRPLGWVCFFIGGLWSVQNIWYTTL